MSRRTAKRKAPSREASAVAVASNDGDALRTAPASAPAAASSSSAAEQLVTRTAPHESVRENGGGGDTQPLAGSQPEDALSAHGGHESSQSQPSQPSQPSQSSQSSSQASQPSLSSQSSQFIASPSSSSQGRVVRSTMLPPPAPISRKRNKVDRVELLLSSPQRASGAPPLMSSSPLRGMGAAPAQSPRAAGGGVSPGRSASGVSSRGAQLLKLAQSSETSPGPKSPSTRAFAISAVQSQPAAAALSLLGEPLRANAAGNALPKRLFGSQPTPLSPMRTAKARKREAPHVSQDELAVGDPLRALLERLCAVETVLALHRARGTTPWWSSVAVSAASLAGERSFSTELVQLANGLWPGCWPVAYLQRQHDEDEQYLPYEMVVSANWTSNGCESELAERRATFAAALLALSASGADLPLAPLPDKPMHMPSVMQSGVARLGVAAETITDTRRRELGEMAAPAHLSHVDAATLLAVRVRAEEARLLMERHVAAAADGSADAEQLLVLAEQLHSLALVNSRYHWPLDVMASKVLRDANRAGARDALLVQLGQLHDATGGWVTLVQNTFADGGTFVVLAKERRFAHVLEQLRNAKT